LTSSLAEVLRTYSKEGWGFAFVIQGGNQGDRMIYMGAVKLAHLLNIKYTTYYCPQPTREVNRPIPEFGSRTIIYMHGGGGFNKWWAWSPKLIKELRDRNPENTIIVGPSTFELDEKMIKTLPPDVTYFARERTSYEYLKQFFPSVYIDHDTALQLKFRDGYLDILLGSNNLKDNYKLLAIRDDKESANFPVSVNRSKFKVQVDPCKEGSWASLHLNASVIMTNRCHSAILGSILGKRTILFPGSYHKNKSIYEYSLKGRGVEWVE
jgi:exopolysaccharide biosynthesis predicted pyruvyltransferase EpsI